MTVLLPALPADGGFLVLNEAQISNLDLLCLIRRTYPRTKIYAQRTLSASTLKVMSIANPRPHAMGMLGYYTRRNPDNRRVLIDAMRKLKNL